jgi:hypothetical protein
MPLGVGKTKRERNILAITKGEEQYVFLFDNKSRSALLRQLGKFAMDPELSFDWGDVGTLCKAARRLREAQ